MTANVPYEYTMLRHYGADHGHQAGEVVADARARAKMEMRPTLRYSSIVHA
jgi:hypothetical protein